MIVLQEIVCVHLRAHRGLEAQAVVDQMEDWFGESRVLPVKKSMRKSLNIDFCKMKLTSAKGGSRPRSGSDRITARELRAMPLSCTSCKVRESQDGLDIWLPLW